MTAQFPDTILFAGTRCALMSNPLESLFDQGHPRPPFVSESTANWRGYVAHWEIEDDRLFLVGLDARVVRGPPRISRAGQDGLSAYSEADLFPASGGRVHASWFSGTLRIPDGDLVKYVHLGYESRYERYVMLDFKGGELVLTRIVSDAELQRQHETARSGKFGRLLEAWRRRWPRIRSRVRERT